MEKFNIETYEPKGDLVGVPKEIIKQMLIEQVAQGNPEDVTVFEKHLGTKAEIGGFDFHLTDHCAMWNMVAYSRDYNSFFEVYPKFKRGDKVYVWDGLRKPNFSVTEPAMTFVSKCDGEEFPFVVSMQEDISGTFDGSVYQHCILVSDYEKEQEEKAKVEIIELTLEDISAGKGVGVPVHLLRIKK